MNVSDGYVRVGGFRLYYRSFRPNFPKGTVLCLHGGPGSPLDYMLPLADLGNAGYRVVLYEQLGCGRSDDPSVDNVKLFSIERYADEVEGVRRALQLGRIHLMGSSFGGQVALVYALKHQPNLRSLIISGGLASVPLALKELNHLKSQLPARFRSIIRNHERSHDYDNPEYKKAVDFVYRKHLCRMKKWPKEVSYSMNRINMRIYKHIWGPNELVCDGITRHWNITRELHGIRVPSLITCGRYDTLTPYVAMQIQKRIHSSSLVVFERSGHLTMWDERQKYIRTLREFLDNVSSKTDGISI